jgi:SAM-dependent methyltransferase
MMKKEPFLDLGANNIPHPKATHAVDMWTKKYMLNKENIYAKKNNFKEGDTTKETFERRLKQMDYIFHFNYNTKRLPWPNNSFKIVYSNASLGGYGKVPAFKESYRVLKHGAKLEFTMGNTQKSIENKMKMLHEVGFKEIKIIKRSEPWMLKGKVTYNVTITATKP